jgi:hypothetical protein
LNRFNRTHILIFYTKGRKGLFRSRSKHGAFNLAILEEFLWGSLSLENIDQHLDKTLTLPGPDRGGDLGFPLMSLSPLGYREINPFSSLPDPRFPYPEILFEQGVWEVFWFQQFCNTACLPAKFSLLSRRFQ